MMRRHILLATAALLLLGGCTQSEPLGEDPVKVQEQQDMEIMFGSYTASSPSATRRGATRAGTTGAINTEAALQAAGFCVYCYFTEGERWGERWDEHTAVEPNFMYNQQVEWTAVNGRNRWYYFPVKYWPNDNQPADNNGAQGSVEHNYLHFFAYAPAVGKEQLNGTYNEGDKTWDFKKEGNTSDYVIMNNDAANANGIVAISRNTYTGAPSLKYKWTEEVNQQVDLLYDAQTNMYKTKQTGEGYVNGAVNLKFSHALSRLNIKVQRIYNDITTPSSMGAHEGETKIFVNQLKLTGSVADQATFTLDDGTWSELASPASHDIVFSGNHFNSAVGGTPPDDSDIAFWELNKFGSKPDVGVDNTARQLTTDESPALLIPQENITLTATIQYAFVTRDNDLALSTLTDNQGNKYGRIVNTIEKTIDDPIDFEKGKQYTLLIKIGVETVEFEVVGVEDWDFPIRFKVTADSYQNGGTGEHTLNEDGAPTSTTNPNP